MGSPGEWAGLSAADTLPAYTDPRYVFKPGEDPAAETAAGIGPPPAVVLCDFDGTISIEDTLDVVIDRAIGVEAREAIDGLYETGDISFRELISRELSPIECSFDAGCEAIAAACAAKAASAGQPLIGTGVVDPAFPSFCRCCHDAGVPIVVLSGGMSQLVRHFLADAFAEEPIDAGAGAPTDADLRAGRWLPAGAVPVQANTLWVGHEVAESGSAAAGQWSATFFDGSPSGNDKAAAVAAWKASGTRVVFIGDGVSDLPVIGAGADLLFAKRGKALERVCAEKGQRCTAFDQFGEVQAGLQALLHDDETAGVAGRL